MCKVSSSVLLLAAAIGVASGITDYCPKSKELCKYTAYDQHITCGATGDLLPSCPSDARTVDLTNENIQQIVDLHNQYRNKIAGGNEPRFSSASKMTTMTWNQDLADYAGLNVRRCRQEHDCHSTPDYKFSGQNLNHISTYGGGATFKDIPSLISESIKIFYDEKQYATMSNINNCCGSDSIPHFLEMVLDKNNEVGCAVAEYTSSQGKTSYIACNYSYTIILGHTVYESGAPGSACQTGTNPKYPNLCSTAEYVNPNQVF